jgi:hypothetical protein
MVVSSHRQITEKDLSNWRLIETFQQELATVAAKARFHPTFSDPTRQLTYQSYLSLFLLGVFNPVVTSMRALCAVSGLQQVQEQVGCSQVSLGSFSEIQHVLDPDLLKQVFENLIQRMPAEPKADPRLAHLELIAQDGSLWRALPRMAWAEYGVGSAGQAKGVRLHLRFNVLTETPVDAMLTQGKVCERKALREMLQPGQTNVGDRYYGNDYKLFTAVDGAKAFFVFRIKDQAVIHTEEELPITPADRAAGVVRHAWVHLGATEELRSMRVRLVEIIKDGQHLLLVTNHAVETASAEMVGLIYRRRWSIELFFRWVKCILKNRHFFAESPKGVAIQMYLALIAAVMLQGITGRRPTKRMMEMLQFYSMGWASAEEVVALGLRQAVPKQAPSR